MEKENVERISQQEAVNVLIKPIPNDWRNMLEPEFKKSYFLKLAYKVVLESAQIYPNINEIFSFMVPLDKIKVVIIGQDPYHGVGQAHGLSFSVKKGVKPPPSLINIFKELSNDIPGFTMPKHGFLMGWALQGVLLLNASLTVRKGQANSHGKS